MAFGSTPYLPARDRPSPASGQSESHLANEVVVVLPNREVEPAYLEDLRRVGFEPHVFISVGDAAAAMQRRTVFAGLLHFSDDNCFSAADLGLLLDALPQLRLVGMVSPAAVRSPALAELIAQRLLYDFHT